jgi:YggT family protein
MLNPFVNLLSSLISLYIICVLVQAVLSLLIAFKVVNGYQPIVQRITYALSRLVDPALRPIRKILPDMGGIDISPIILILLLHFVQDALFTYLYNL